MSDYALFGMCPLTQVKIGGGLTLGGVGTSEYVWTHGECIGKFCRLYTYKLDENGEIYAQGCNLQFLGLTRDEINQNFDIKNAIISEHNDQVRAENQRHR